MVHIYVDTDAGTNGDGSIGSPYNSLTNALIAGNSPVTRANTVVIHVYGSTSHTSPVTISASYTNATYQLYIVGNRTLPYWDATAFNMVVSGDNGFNIGGYVHLRNLQIRIISSGFADIAVYVNGAGQMSVANSILRGSPTASGQNYHSGVEANYSGGNIDIYNNIIYDFIGADDSCGIWNHRNGTMRAYNNTVYNCSFGIAHSQGGSSMSAKNNVVSTCGVTNFNGIFLSSSTSNTSTDGTRPNTDDTNLINQTVNFTDTTNKVLSITSPNSSVIDNAEDLSSSNVPFNTDICGTIRTTWDRGAFEFQSGGPLVGASALIGGRVLCGSGNLIS